MNFWKRIFGNERKKPSGGEAVPSFSPPRAQSSPKSNIRDQSDAAFRYVFCFRDECDMQAVFKRLEKDVPGIAAKVEQRKVLAELHPQYPWVLICENGHFKEVNDRVGSRSHDVETEVSKATTERQSKPYRSVPSQAIQSGESRDASKQRSEVVSWHRNGQEKVKRGELAEAITCYDRALAIDPKESAVLADKGLSLLELENFTGAIVCFDKALSIDQTIPHAWTGKTLALVGIQRHQEALTCITKALQTHPTASSWSLKATVLVSLRQHDEAIECIDRSLAIEPGDASNWLNKGLSEIDLGRAANGLASLKRYLELAPSQRPTDEIAQIRELVRRLT